MEKGIGTWPGLSGMEQANCAAGWHGGVKIPMSWCFDLGRRAGMRQFRVTRAGIVAPCEGRDLDAMS